MSKNTKYTIGTVVLKKGQHQEHSLEDARPSEEWELLQSRALYPPACAFPGISHSGLSTTQVIDEKDVKNKSF